MAGGGKPATVPEGSFLCQHSKGLSNQGRILWYGCPGDAGDVLAGMGPLLGPPLHAALLCQAELSSPQACGVQQSKLYCPHAGAALQ